jgi:hypothetical protein
LRRMRAAAERRPFVILGASGAGKSSLLKAGIIPRLRREAPAWLPLRAFRPGADPLLNFAESLTRTLADFGVAEALGDMRSRLDEAWHKVARGPDYRLTPEGLGALQAALEAEGRRLREAAGRGAASILVSVDQAEELARAEGDSGEALADYLRVALLAATSWHLAFTIRNDSLPELQSHRRFQDLKLHPYDLRALPAFRFESEAPAKRYGVTVDSKLVDALVENAPKDDTLPLLAFALQRLWRQFAAKRALVREHYDRIGGLQGLIEDAAERALRGLSPEEDVTLPGPPPKRRIDLGAATFVPALAQINDQGAVIRRIAAWNGFSDEQRELLNRFDQWRLVVRKRADTGNGETAGGTVEVAHEACWENVGFHCLCRTCITACWIKRSSTVGMPSFRTPPSGFGISMLENRGHRFVRYADDGRRSRAGSNPSGRGSKRCGRFRWTGRIGIATARMQISSITGRSVSPRPGHSARTQVMRSG